MGVAGVAGDSDRGSPAGTGGSANASGKFEPRTGDLMPLLRAPPLLRLPIPEEMAPPPTHPIDLSVVAGGRSEGVPAAGLYSSLSVQSRLLWNH